MSWMKLNVGGEMFETTRETLTKLPDSQLAEIVNSIYNPKVEKAVLNLTTQIDNLRFNPGEMLDMSNISQDTAKILHLRTLSLYQNTPGWVVGGVVVGGASALVAPAALSYVGFTSAGVAKGSLAASWQAGIGERLREG